MKKISPVIGMMLLLLGMWLVWSYVYRNVVQIVLITVDTTRIDHLGCYGYTRDTSPNIDELASSGVRFINCYTSMPTTDPAHISLLTSSYPRTHGVLKNGMKLSNPDVYCLAELFREKGYATAAITARAGLNPSILDIAGFDYVSAPKENIERKASQVYEEAVKFIDGHMKEDFFLWVHFYDPHMAYDPPAPYNSMFNDGYRGLPTKQVSFLPKNVTWEADETAYNVSLYDGEIRYMDHYVGKLLDHVNQRISGRSAGPLIVLVADHGETLDELQSQYGYVFDHGEFLINQEIRIPLIMSWKGKLPEDKEVHALIEVIDIAPTIVDLVFEGDVREFWGKSFKSAILDSVSEDKRYAIIQRRHFERAMNSRFEGEQYAVVTRDYKLISSTTHSVELFSATADEVPENNLARNRPDVVKEYLKELQEWQTRLEPFESSEVVPEETREALKALGYLP